MPILITQTKLLTEQSAIQYHYCLGRQNINHIIYHPVPILLTQTILTMQATINSHFWLRRQYPRPSNTTAAHADNLIDHTVDHTVDCILRQYRRTYNRPSNTNTVYTDVTINHANNCLLPIMFTQTKPLTISSSIQHQHFLHTMLSTM